MTTVRTGLDNNVSELLGKMEDLMHSIYKDATNVGDENGFAPWILEIRSFQAKPWSW